MYLPYLDGAGEHDNRPDPRMEALRVAAVEQRTNACLCCTGHPVVTVELVSADGSMMRSGACADAFCTAVVKNLVQRLSAMPGLDVVVYS